MNVLPEINIVCFNQVTQHSYSKGGAKESDIIKEALALSTSLPHDHIVQTLADLSTCIKLGNCELPVKHFK